MNKKILLVALLIATLTSCNSKPDHCPLDEIKPEFVFDKFGLGEMEGKHYYEFKIEGYTSREIAEKLIKATDIIYKHPQEVRNVTGNYMNNEVINVILKGRSENFASIGMNVDCAYTFEFICKNECLVIGSYVKDFDEYKNDSVKMEYIKDFMNASIETILVVAAKQ